MFHTNKTNYKNYGKITKINKKLSKLTKKPEFVYSPLQLILLVCPVFKLERTKVIERLLKANLLGLLRSDWGKIGRHEPEALDFDQNHRTYPRVNVVVCIFL